MDNAKLEVLTSCPICMEPLKDPRVLQCLHNFCSPCLAKVKGQSDVIACPECRHVTRGVADVTSLLENLQLRSITERVAAERRGLCGICGEAVDADSKHFCYLCQRQICGECEREHRGRPELRHHVIKPLQPESDVCQRHLAVLVSYCVDCDVSICARCLMIWHKKHELKSLRDAAMAQRFDLSVLLFEVVEVQKQKDEKVEDIVAFYKECQQELQTEQDRLVRDRLTQLTTQTALYEQGTVELRSLLDSDLEDHVFLKRFAEKRGLVQALRGQLRAEQITAPPPRGDAAVGTSNVASSGERTHASTSAARITREAGPRKRDRLPEDVERFLPKLPKRAHVTTGSL